MANTNVAPYFDDFDEGKNFHRILYRPSYAVQARELTQQQTILQNQLRQVSNHNFKNGSMIIPGHVSLNKKFPYVQVESVFDYDGVGGVDPAPVPEAADWVGLTLMGVDSKVVVKVVMALDIEDEDPMSLYYEYISSEDGNALLFNGEEIAQIVPAGESTLYRTTVKFDHVLDINDDPTEFYDSENPLFDFSGNGTSSTVDAGTYYIDGFFVNIEKQTTLISKYSSNPSVKVGLQKYESFISSEEDPSLNDNAQGSYNYAAPGAHRLKLELKLEYQELDAAVDADNFIQLQVIDNGTLIQELRKTEYGELRKEFAHRTFDESGHYTVDPFLMTVSEHLKDPDNVKYKHGSFLLEDGGDEAKVNLNLDPGKAYVYGYEFESIAPVNLTADKARETAHVNNVYTDYNMANYLVGFVSTGAMEMPPISDYHGVELHHTEGGPAIGTARIRQFGFYDNVNITPWNNNDPTAPIEQDTYKLSMFDISLNEDENIANVRFLSSGTGFNCEILQTFTVNPEDTTDESSWKTSLFNTTQSSPILSLANSYIEGLDDIHHDLQQVHTGTLGANEDITISYSTTPGDEEYPGQDPTDYVVFVSGEMVAFTFVGASNGTITLHSHSGSTNDPCEVFYRLGVSNSTPNQKNLNSDAWVRVDTTKLNRKVGGLTYIEKADVYKVMEVWMTTDGSSFSHTNPTGTNVTRWFYLDTGQRDGFYDIASLELISGYKIEEGMELHVHLQYFEHVINDGFFTRDSYPASIPYEKIPIFTGSGGRVFPLSDCIDFRPKMVDEMDPTNPLRFENGFTASSYNPLPNDNSYFISDYDYFLPRIDTVVIDPEDTFRIIRGEASASPRPPSYPENSMKIYEIEFLPYCINLTYVTPKFIENKRYTMRDIGSLEKRIKNLEYYSTLSLMETDTANLKFTDENGLDRFKHGFIVEPFTSHGIGNYLSGDYNCAIDPHRGHMRPRCSETAIELVSDLVDGTRFHTYASNGVTTVMPGTDDGTGNEIRMPTMTLDFTHEKMIHQPYASRKESVNPYLFASFIGKLSFWPQSDFWKDEENRGTFTVNNDAHYGALASMAAAEQAQDGVTWGAWQTDWIGVDTDVSTDISSSISEENVTQAGNFDYQGTDSWVGGDGEAYINSKYNVDGGSRVVDVLIDRSRDHDTEQEVRVTVEQDIQVTTTTAVTTSMETTITQGQSRQGTNQQTDWGPKTVTKSMGNRLVAMNHVPFMRASEIEVSIQKFRPNTIAYAFFDKVRIDEDYINFDDVHEDYKKEVGGEWRLFSDTTGDIKFTFNVPAQTFYTGDREMYVSDHYAYGDAIHTKASGVFHSGGISTTSEDVVLSTKTIDFAQERKELNQEREISATDTDTATASTTQSEMKTIRTSEWIDPLAQSIIVEEEGGCFVTKVDLYFARKPAHAVPLMFQFREMVNGYPGPRIIPYSDVIVPWEDVTDDLTGATATTIYMEAPVFLKQNVEYAMVVLADTIDYEIWVSHMSVDATEERDKDITTGVEISKQPYLGTMFKSQNASTWTAEQQEDMKFTIYKAKFNTDAGNKALFGNKAQKATQMKRDAFYMTSGSTMVRIYQKNHGMPIGSIVTLDTMPDVVPTGRDLLGIPYSEFIQDHDISNVEFDSFTINVTTPATGTGFADNGTMNGLEFTIECGIQIDTYMPIFSTISPAGSTLTWKSNMVSGKSISGNETPWVREDLFTPILEVSNNFPSTTRLIANKATEDAKITHSGNPSGGRSIYFEGRITTMNENISPVINLSHMGCALIGNRVDAPATTVAPFELGVYDIEWDTSKIARVTHISHGMVESASIRIHGTLSTEMYNDPELSINGTYKIEVFDEDSYDIHLENEPDVAYVPGVALTGNIEWSETHSKFIDENQAMENTTASRYVTTKITLQDPSTSFVALLGASVQHGCDFELYYRYMNEYDESPFYRKEWTRINRHANQQYLYSNTPADMKEYKFQLELDGLAETNPEAMYELPEAFVSIAFKIVMTSTDTTKVPEFNDLRVICLGV